MRDDVEAIEPSAEPAAETMQVPQVPVTVPVKVRKFDRPPPPRDWRWWVGGLGRTLIACGLLMFGFVAYQLWGTGIETARAQNALETEFEDLLAGRPSDASPTPTSEPDETVPDATVPNETVPEVGVPDETVPDSTVADGAAAAFPVQFQEGDPIARIEMPVIGVDAIVVAGVEKSDLKRGPGHYPETPMPGQLGNTAIAGHRTTYGQPFFDVDRLRVGDEIVLTTVTGRYVYLVTGQKIVSPEDYQVIATTDPTIATITLTSCHPKWTARERIIITGELDVEASTGPAGDPVLNYGRPLTDDAVPADSDETASTEPVVTEPSGDTSGSVPDTIVDEGPGDGAPSTIDAEAVDAGIADAFSDGWFSDPAANGQVALWGVVLAAIGVLSYLLSRRAKRDWVGFAVGIVPFVVTLYFFFQNVNRLLPPNL